MSHSLSLIPDAPIDNASFDRLDRMSFVRSFTEAIRSAKGPNSVVLALAGPWGSGKSSLLNLIGKEVQDTAEGEPPPLLVRFNPWWFTETGQLIAAFLQQLAAAVSRDEVQHSLGGAAEALDELAEALANPGDPRFRTVTISPSNELSSGNDPTFESLPSPDTQVNPGKPNATAKLKQRRDIDRVRQKVVDTFLKSDRRILIFMDDIDRLAPEEMSQLLLIVRAIADFPFTTYVLSFDFEVVVESMENKLGVDGRTYLEKVIQLQIDVPLPTRMTLERMVLAQLGEIDPQSRLKSEEEKTFFRMMFEGGIKHFLATPRACTRFLNVIRFVYPTVKGQVFLPDLLGLSCLMAFSSQAIQAIRSFEDAFVGPCDEQGKGWVELSAFHEQWLNKLAPKDRPHVETVVRLLFPKVAWALNGPVKGERFLSIWDQQMRICSPQHFDTYFRLGLSAGEASEYQWQNLVELLDDAASFARALHQYGPVGDEKAESWLTDLMHQASQFIEQMADPAQAKRMFAALLKRGDSIDQPVKEIEDGWIEPIHRVVSLLIECLQKVDSAEKRMETIEDSIVAGGGLYVTAELMKQLEHRTDLLLDRGEPSGQELRSQIFNKLMRKFDGRMLDAIESGDLLMHPRRWRILRSWCRYGRSSKIKPILAASCKDDKQLVEWLEEIKSDRELFSQKDIERRLSLPLDLLKNLFNGSELVNRFEVICDEEPDWLSLDAELMLTSLVEHLSPTQS